MVGQDEALLWRRACGGDAQAFAAVFDLHRDRVYGQAVRLLDTRGDAEDVTASTFLELWRRRAAVRLVNGSVLPWLLVTTANLARNAARARRRYRDFLLGMTLAAAKTRLHRARLRIREQLPDFPAALDRTGAL